MSVSIVHAQCVDQALRITNVPPTLASGGENEIRIDITFDSAWEGYGKTAVFYRDDSKEAKAYHVVMVDNTCVMPYEVATKPGRVIFGITGIKGTVVKTTEVVALTLKKGSISIGKVPEPLPDIYKQLMTAYGAVSEEVAVQRARINNLIKLEDGSTTGDAELADIRVAHDGTTYPSAGDAVRAVGAGLDNAKYNASRPNLIDMSRSEFGYYSASNVWLSGYSNLETTSDYIGVTAGDKYTLTMEYPSTSMYGLAYIKGENVPGSWARFLFYDAAKSFLSSTDYSFTEKRGVYTVTAPEGAQYARVSWRHYFTPMQIKLEHGGYPTAIQPEAATGLVHAGYYTTEGAIALDSAAATYTTKRTMPFAVEGGAEYTVYNLGEYSGERWAAIAFFDAAGKIVERVTFSTVAGNDVRTITAPETAVCAGLTARVDHLYAFAIFKSVQEHEKTLEQHHLDLYLASLAADDSAAKEPPALGLAKAIAHRGYSAGAPENTLPAYKLARQNGFDYAECDVSFTADGVAVLLHDSTIDRTSNGTGNIADLTYEQASAYDYGAWYAEEYTGTPLPTFNEFLALCKDIGLRPYIELKAGTAEQINGLVKAVKQYGLQDVATWISFSANYLALIKAADSTARLGYVVAEVTEAVITTAKGLRTGENEVFLDSASYTDAEVKLCANAGLPLEVWTVNDAATIRALPAYISGVTSDSQHAVRALLCSCSDEPTDDGEDSTDGIVQPQNLSETYNLATNAAYRTEGQVTKSASGGQYVWSEDSAAFTVRLPAVEGDTITFAVFNNVGHGYVFGCYTADGKPMYSATKAMLDSGTKAWMTYADGVATVDVSGMIAALGVSDMIFCVQYANEAGFFINSKKLPLRFDWLGLSEVDEQRLSAVEAAAGLNIGINFNPNLPCGYYTPTETVYTLGRTSTAAELYAVLDPLVDGTYCTRELLFTESGGLPGYVYRFKPQVPGNRTSGDNTDFPTILIIADHHGQEKGSAISIAYFLQDLVRNWATNPILEYLRFSVNLVVVPTANPYGFEFQKHKNRNLVDLNRNYDADWAETDSALQTYGGASAASEIETQALQALIRATSNALLYIDYHTFGALCVTDYWNINWHMLCAAPYRSAAPEELAVHQIQRATAHYKQTYFPDGIGDAAFTGHITYAQYGGNSKVYARQQGIPNALVFEGCGGLPDESEAYSQRAIRLNVEQIGNYLYNAVSWFVRNPSRIRQEV